MLVNFPMLSTLPCPRLFIHLCSISPRHTVPGPALELSQLPRADLCGPGQSSGQTSCLQPVGELLSWSSPSMEDACSPGLSSPPHVHPHKLVFPHWNAGKEHHTLSHTRKLLFTFRLGIFLFAESYWSPGQGGFQQSYSSCTVAHRHPLR